jgi:Flp pilus assembly secretin CpaC
MGDPKAYLPRAALSRLLWGPVTALPRRAATIRDMFLALVAALTLSSNDTIRLNPGGQEVLRYPGLKRVALGVEDVASVHVTGAGEILLIAKQPGKTSMTLWLGDNKVLYRTIVVDSGRGSQLAQMVHDQVSPTLKVDEYNGKVVIDGVLDAVEEFDRLKILVGDDPNVKLLVRMNPRVMPFVAAQITEALAREGLRQAHAVAVGNKILLEGSVADAAEVQKAQTIADAIYSQSQVGLTTTR